MASGNSEARTFLLTTLGVAATGAVIFAMATLLSSTDQTAQMATPAGINHQPAATTEEKLKEASQQTIEQLEAARKTLEEAVAKLQFELDATRAEAARQIKILTTHLQISKINARLMQIRAEMERATKRTAEEISYEISEIRNEVGELAVSSSDESKSFFNKLGSDLENLSRLIDDGDERALERLDAILRDLSQRLSA